MLQHFYAYSLESSDGYTRHTFDGNVSARDLAETYLPVFQTCAAVDVAQVMCSYNSVNGVPTCLDSHAQNTVLRERFGFAGMIVSDCDAIADAWEENAHDYAANASDATAKAITGGTDMDCGITYTAGAAEALSSGALPVEALDTAVARSIAMRIRLGELDRPDANPYRDTSKYGRQALASIAARALALQAAEESIVLLKNDGDLLPLSSVSADGGLRIGVLGPTAAPRWNPDDKEDYCPPYRVDPLQGLQTETAGGSNFTVVHCEGCCAEQTTHSIPSKCDPKKAAAFSKTVDVVILALGGDLGGEGRDWEGKLPTDQAELAAAVIAANARSVAVLVHGNPMSIDPLAKSYPAIVEAFEGGQSAGTALARMLLGRSEVAPSGVLPYTIYPDDYTSQLKMSDMNMRAGPGRTYRFYKGKPTFAFGHGLTYTRFDLAWHSSPAAKVSAVQAQRGLRFEIRVENVGERVGAKVVAAYVSAVGTGVADVPRRQLLGIGKIKVGILLPLLSLWQHASHLLCRSLPPPSPPVLYHTLTYHTLPSSRQESRA